MSITNISFILNIVIFIMVVFATISMLVGFQFMSKEDVLSEKRISAFKFFTLDSNVLIGAISIIVAYFEYQLLKGKIEEIPSLIYILKLVGTVGVILTFLVTTIYLAPRAEKGYFSMFLNSNLFFHFIIPILSFISFVFFESTDKIKFVYTFCGMIPMIVYSIFYTINVVTHLENGMSSKDYDWYGFLIGGLWTIVIIIPFMIFITYTISFGLWYLNKSFV